MIKIRFKETPKTFELTVKGHAGFGKSGEDVVCAGVSTLTTTLAVVLKQIEIKGGMNKATIDLDEGNAHFKVLPKNIQKGEVKRAIAQTLIGYSLLSEAYSDYVDFVMV